MKKVFFCHGIPGSKADALLFQRANPDVEVIALDLLKRGPEAISEVFRETLAREFNEETEPAIELVGFSIGAMGAFQIASRFPEVVARVTLISPAAPLALGEFLPLMAGQAVFQLAISKPALLALLTNGQSLAARWFPRLLLKALFANSTALEKELLEDAAFLEAMESALKNSFVQNKEHYLSYVKAYVADWSAYLDQVKCPVVLWHGSRDAWSPPQMSQALVHRLGAKATLHFVEGTGHYSTMASVRL